MTTMRTCHHKRCCGCLSEPDVELEIYDNDGSKRNVFVCQEHYEMALREARRDRVPVIDLGQISGD